MKIELYTLHGKQYKGIKNDGERLPTVYHIDTPDDLIMKLESLRKNKTRVVFDFGDTKTLQSWGEICGISGYIGRSKGYEAYYPILVHNSRSLGGGLLSTNCILSIKESRGKRLVYELKQSI